MAEAIVNGVRLAYELHGQGKPVLFLPTDGMVKEAWLALAGPAPALAEAGYQAVLVDFRGCGGSDAPPPPYTVADLAADTAGLIEQLGLGRCRLVGYGLGGAVAEHLAAERPDLVRAAALLGSAGPPTAFARFAEEAALEADEVIDRFPRLQVAIGLLALFTPAQLQDDAFVQGLTERMLARPPGAIPGLHAAAVAWAAEYQATHAARWAKISVPLLAVAFEQSLGFPAGQRAAARPGDPRRRARGDPRGRGWRRVHPCRRSRRGAAQVLRRQLTDLTAGPEDQARTAPPAHRAGEDQPGTARLAKPPRTGTRKGRASAECSVLTAATGGISTGLIPARTSRSCTDPPRTPGHNRQLNLGTAAKHLNSSPPADIYSRWSHHCWASSLQPMALVSIILTNWAAIFRCMVHFSGDHERCGTGGVGSLRA